MKRNLRIKAMIAAAGDSVRMGSHKAKIPLFGIPAICYVMQTLSHIRPIISATLPPSLLFDHELKEMLAMFHPEIQVNHYKELGYLGSVRTMLNGEALDGIIIIPIDSPVFEKNLLLTMITMAWDRCQKPTIIVPCFNALSGHPVYLSKHFFGDILSERFIHVGLRGIISAHRKSAHHLFCPDARILLNLNYPTDLTKLFCNRALT